MKESEEWQTDQNTGVPARKYFFQASVLPSMVQQGGDQHTSCLMLVRFIQKCVTCVSALALRSGQLLK